MKETTARILAAMSVDELRLDVEELCRHDRRQASAGIELAADYVAARLSANDALDVSVEYVDLKDRPRWGTFDAPVPWTPRECILRDSETGETLADYGVTPMVVASYSGCDRRGTRRLRACLATDESELDEASALILTGGQAEVVEAIRTYPRIGAIVVGPESGQVVPRIEVAPDTRTAVVALSGERLGALIRRVRGREVWLDLTFAVETRGQMPVVRAKPNAAEGPLTRLSAHLCHPAPSANDNAAGCAALLSLARVIGQVKPDAAVEFVWLPEIVGTAYLLTAESDHPRSVINLDMVGAGRAEGAYTVIERTPDHVGGTVDLTLARAFATAPGRLRNYSGAVQLPPVDWICGPFVGAADNWLYVDDVVRIPCTQVGCWPDHLNHTSGDTPDRVDWSQLRIRASIIGAAAIHEGNYLSWNMSQLIVVDAITRLEGILNGPAAAHGEFSPWEEQHLDRHVRQLLAAGRTRAEWLASHCPPGDVEGLMDTLTRLAEARLGRSVESQVDIPVLSSRAIRRCWTGPFNLRYAFAAMTADKRSKWESVLRERGNFTRLLALSIAIGRSFTDVDELFWNAACSSDLSIPPSLAADWYGDLVEAGLCVVADSH